MVTFLILAGIGYGLYTLAKAAAQHPETAAGAARLLLGIGKK